MKKRKRIFEKCENKLQKLRDYYHKVLSRKPDYSHQGEYLERASKEQAIQSSQFLRKEISRLLPEIEYAITRIRNGTYGICENTGGFIEEKRLIAVPWTRVSKLSLEEDYA